MDSVTWPRASDDKVHTLMREALGWLDTSLTSLRDYWRVSHEAVGCEERAMKAIKLQREQLIKRARDTKAPASGISTGFLFYLHGSTADGRHRCHSDTTILNVVQNRLEICAATDKVTAIARTQGIRIQRCEGGDIDGCLKVLKSYSITTTTGRVSLPEAQQDARTNSTCELVRSHTALKDILEEFLALAANLVT